jgi:hypothetical protein
MSRSLEFKPAYTDFMQLTLDIPDETAALFQTRGVEISSLVQELLAKEAAKAAPVDDASASAAVDRIIALRKNLSLGGISIRDLINDGRKY